MCRGWRKIILKILSPKGNLLKIDKVARVAEKHFEFNGNERNLFEVAKNSKVPANGLAFEIVSKTSEPFFPQEIYVGNLKPEKVEEILNALLVQGYYDFTKLEFQTVKLEKDVVIDGGDSLPFSTDITVCVLSNRHFTNDYEMLLPLYPVSPNLTCEVPDLVSPAAFEDDEEENNEEE